MNAFDFITIYGSTFGVGLLVWISSLGLHLVFGLLKSIIWQ